MPGSVLTGRRLACFWVGALALCLGACTASVTGTGDQPGSTPSSGGRVGGTGSGSSSGSGNGSGTNGSGGAAAGVASGGTVGAGGAGGLVIPASPPAAVLVPTARLARLSRPQWENSVKDLLKLTDISAISANVTGDAVVGLDNDVDSLFVNDTLRSDLADASVALAQQVTGNATALAKLLPANAPTDLAGKAKAFITTVGQRAYRRPLTTAEVTEATGLFNQGPTLYPTGTDAFVAGTNLVLQLFLQSPYFLYRTELSTAVVNGKIPLNDYEVAAKISYATANTMPDDTLFTAAANGQIHTADQVTTQATRLLTSDVGALARDHLHFQIYRLGAYDGITRDTSVFPAFTTATPAAMRQEALLFLRWVFDQGGGVKEIFTSPVGFANKTLAPLYKATGNFTDQFVKVDLDPSQRAGLLTQTGFLSEYAIANDPDSIHRGVFVNQRILCVTLPPPDPKATPLVDLQPNMTNRQRVEATTGKGTCGEACHGTWINPAGFAFEEFDAVGQYRTTDRGLPINSADTYPFTDGMRSYNNAVEFASAIVQGSQVHSCYTTNWMTYLYGRTIQTTEQDLLNYWALLSQAGKLPMKDMILAMVTSDSFLNRLP